MARLPACTIFDGGRRPINHLGKSDGTAYLVGIGVLLAHPDGFRSVRSSLWLCTFFGSADGPSMAWGCQVPGSSTTEYARLPSACQAWCLP